MAAFPRLPCVRGLVWMLRGHLQNQAVKVGLAVPLGSLFDASLEMTYASFTFLSSLSLHSPASLSLQANNKPEIEAALFLDWMRLEPQSMVAARPAIE